MANVEAGIVVEWLRTAEIKGTEDGVVIYALNLRGVLHLHHKTHSGEIVKMTGKLAVMI